MIKQKKMRHYFIIFPFLLLLSSCESADSRIIKQKLSAWDTQIENNPAAVKDSLKTLSVGNLSREDRAYYNLLKIICDDKTYADFENDSLINAVVKYYTTHPQNNDNYIRSLVYQGVVRTRAGVSDSTVYEPLKKADKMFRKQSNPKPSLGYMINYFLGNVHYNHANHDLADRYFHYTLEFAKEENNTSHIFDTFLALYWNEMIQDRVNEGKKYLDILSSFYDKLPAKRYFILNAQSVYYDTRGDYRMALEKEKAQLLLSEEQKECVNLSSLYYVISDRYKSLNELDSAMYYAQLAKDNIHDFGDRFSYLVFSNLSNISEKGNDFKTANEYLKKSFEIYQLSEKARLATRMVELEKKYDLSEAENVALRSRENSLVIALISLILTMLLIILLMINRRNRRKARIELMRAEHKAEKQALLTKILTEEANKRIWLMQLYGYISDRLASLQDRFHQLSQRYITSQPKTYEGMMEILNHTNLELREIPPSLIPDDEMFYIYTQLKLPNDFLSPKEKVLLMLMVCKADNRQIATFMNTSLESIRVRKSQLKKKMTENGFDVS